MLSNGKIEIWIIIIITITSSAGPQRQRACECRQLATVLQFLKFPLCFGFCFCFCFASLSLSLIAAPLKFVEFLSIGKLCMSFPHDLWLIRLGNRVCYMSSGLPCGISLLTFYPGCFKSCKVSNVFAMITQTIDDRRAACVGGKVKKFLSSSSATAIEI